MGDALTRVVSRAISDAAFRRQLQTNPEGTLKEFDLSAAEIAALTSRDATKLTALGVDQRMSRMLTVGDQAFTGAASRVDVADAATAAARIDPGANDFGIARDAGVEGSGLGRADVSGETGSQAAAVGDEGASGLGRDIDDYAITVGRDADLDAGSSAADLGEANRPAEMLASAESTDADIWAGGTPYGAGRLERMEGATPEADLAAEAVDDVETTGASENTPI